MEQAAWIFELELTDVAFGQDRFARLVRRLRRRPRHREAVIRRFQHHAVECRAEGLHASETVRRIAAKASTPAALLLLQDTAIEMGQFGLERLLAVREATAAGLVYSDFASVSGGRRSPHPVIDYQEGSLRDDFDFGPLVLVDGAALKRAAERMRRRIERAGVALDVRVTADVSQTGGGSLPGVSLDTYVLAVRSPALSADRLGARLRCGEPPVIARIKADEVLLDMRTLLPGEHRMVESALIQASSGTDVGKGDDHER